MHRTKREEIACVSHQASGKYRPGNETRRVRKTMNRSRRSKKNSCNNNKNQHENIVFLVLVKQESTTNTAGFVCGAGKNRYSERD
jgi:hypothetical protein